MGGGLEDLSKIGLLEGFVIGEPEPWIFPVTVVFVATAIVHNTIITAEIRVPGYVHFMYTVTESAAQTCV